MNSTYAIARSGAPSPDAPIDPAMLRTLRDDRGQGLAEYSLILGFIAVLCIAAVAFFGAQINAHYQNVYTTYP